MPPARPSVHIQSNGRAGAIVGLVLLSGFWKSPVAFDVFGTEVRLPGLVRDIGLVIVTLVSLKITPASVHE